METILIIAAVGVMNIGCFLVGARVVQKVVKGEEVTIPNLNPVEAVKEHKEKQEARKEQNRLETIMQNIENYDGTEYGQKEVPGR